MTKRPQIDPTPLGYVLSEAVESFRAGKFKALDVWASPRNENGPALIPVYLGAPLPPAAGAGGAEPRDLPEIQDIHYHGSK